MANVSELNLLHPSDCPILQSVRASFSDWKFYYDYGYICYTKSNVKLYEHRLVLSADTALEVHHLDGVITNNDATNLRLLTPQEHGIIHHPKVRIEKHCITCGSAFLTVQSKRNVSRFCSEPCFRLAQRKVERPSRDELETLMHQLGNWSALGRHYGVSDNAIRKWAKAYNLPCTPDGRKKNLLSDLN